MVRARTDVGLVRSLIRQQSLDERDNLADLTNTATARSNLGLSASATIPIYDASASSSGSEANALISTSNRSIFIEDNLTESAAVTIPGAGEYRFFIPAGVTWTLASGGIDYNSQNATVVITGPGTLALPDTSATGILNTSPGSTAQLKVDCGTVDATAMNTAAGQIIANNTMDRIEFSPQSLLLPDLAFTSGAVTGAVIVRGTRVVGGGSSCADWHTDPSNLSTSTGAYVEGITIEGTWATGPSHIMSGGETGRYSNIYFKTSTETDVVLGGRWTNISDEQDSIRFIQEDGASDGVECSFINAGADNVPIREIDLRSTNDPAFISGVNVDTLTFTNSTNSEKFIANCRINQNVTINGTSHIIVGCRFQQNVTIDSSATGQMVGCRIGGSITNNNPGSFSILYNEPLTFNGSVQLEEISDPGAAAAGIARLHAEDENGFSSLVFQDDNAIRQRLGRDNVIVVRNDTGGTLSKGEVVYINNATGVVPNVAKARANSNTTMPGVGLVVADIGTASFGQVIFSGNLEGVDTTSFSDGDVIYVDASAAGALTATSPTGANISQRVGVVINGASAGAGIIAVDTKESRDTGTGLTLESGGVPGVNLTSSEFSQLQNIDSTTISSTQWGHVGALDQGVASSDSVSFNSLSLTTDLAVTEGGTGASTASGARTNLGLGSIATQDSNNVSITGGSISGITDLAVADGGTGASTASGARSNLGLGTIATQNSNNVSISGGSISGITDLAIADGGTGSSTASAARTALGLAIGSDVQAHDAGLDDIASLAVTNGNFIVGDGGNWVAESGATARTSLGLGSIATQDSSNVSITGGSISGITDLAIADGGTGSSTASAARTALGLAIGSDVQAHDTALDDISGLTLNQGDILVVDASGNITDLALGTDGQVLQSDGSDAVWVDAATSVEKMVLAHTFEDLEEYATSVANGGTVTEGADLDVDFTSDGQNSSKAALEFAITRSLNSELFPFNPDMALFVDSVSAGGTFVSWWFIENTSAFDSGPDQTFSYTTDHAGQGWDVDAGTGTLYASNADGTTQQKTDITGTATETGDFLFRTKVNNGTNVEFYFAVTNSESIPVLKHTETSNLPGSSGFGDNVGTIGIENSSSDTTSQDFEVSNVQFKLDLES